MSPSASQTGRRSSWALLVLVLIVASAPAHPAKAEAASAYGPEVLVSGDDLAVTEFSRSFSVREPAAHYRLRVRNGPHLTPARAAVSRLDIVVNDFRLNEPRGETPLDLFEFSAEVGSYERPIELAEENVLKVYVMGPMGAAVELEIVPLAYDAPTIVPMFMTVRSLSGWLQSGFTVDFECIPGFSPIKECPAELTIAEEGAGQVFTRTVVDEAGHTSSVTIVLNVDGTPPAIVVDGLAPETFTKEEKLHLTGSIREAGALSHVLCGQTEVVVDGGRYACDVWLREGANSVRLYALDEAGNTSSTTLTIHRLSDFAPPVLRIDTPRDLELLRAESTEVAGIVNEPVAWVRVNGRLAEVNGQSFRIHDVPLREGGNLITATAVDRVGNAGGESIRVARDTSPPHVVITFPREGAVIGESHVTVTGIVQDLRAGTYEALEPEVQVGGVRAVVAAGTFTAQDVPVLPGANSLAAAATDQAGNTATTVVQVFRSPVTSPGVRVRSGNHQIAQVGSSLARPLVVAVNDGTGNPVAGADVRFRIVGGGGTLTASTGSGRESHVKTDSEGEASVSWVLGSRAGASVQRVEATARGFEETALFTAVATPGAAAYIFADEGWNRQGTTEQLLPHPLTVLATDSAHNPVPAVPITWQTLRNSSFDGRDETMIETGADGRASARLMLGDFEGIGTIEVLATLDGSYEPAAHFTAGCFNPGDPARTRISGVVLDPTGAPVEGASVAIAETTLKSRTDREGQFSFDAAPFGAVTLAVEAPSPAIVDLVSVPGRTNAVGPIYVDSLEETEGVKVVRGRNTLLKLAAAPGFGLAIARGAARFSGGGGTGRIVAALGHLDKLPAPPYAGTQPSFVVVIEPQEARFDPPAALSLPNLDGIPPGGSTDIYGYNRDLREFVVVARGTASDDGSVIQSEPGTGAPFGGWYYAGDPRAGCGLGVCWKPGSPLNESCTVSIANRRAPVRFEGLWNLYNVPCGLGPLHVQATCLENGVTQFGRSELFEVNPREQEVGGLQGIHVFPRGSLEPAPQKLGVSASRTVLRGVGASARLRVRGTFAGGVDRDLTSSTTGTVYTTTNPRIVTVDQDGLITGASTGTAIVAATNDGVVGLALIQVTR